MKFFPLISQRASCQSLHDLVKEYPELFVDDLSLADAFLVGGGDGWMLDMMRKHKDDGLPFLGLNCGTL